MPDDTRPVAPRALAAAYFTLAWLAERRASR
jgi:hypothetical protein